MTEAALRADLERLSRAATELSERETQLTAALRLSGRIVELISQENDRNKAEIGRLDLLLRKAHNPYRAQIDMLKAEVSRLSERETALKEEAARLRMSLEDFVGVHNEECRYDHNDFCQAHYSDRPCYVATAKALLGEG
jgi:DNA repair exonuclease SbcCD ATPase subunit